MISFLRLVRVQNLIIIALTQILLYYKVLLPCLNRGALSPTLHSAQFFLLVFATVLIAGAAYIVNDILDYEIDKINKPSKVIIHRLLPMNTAWLQYILLNVTGLLMAAYVSWQIENIFYFFLFPFTVLMMWTYSKWLKRSPFWGNLVIAIFCALVPLIVLFSAYDSYQILLTKSAADANTLIHIFTAYTGFAFLTTLFREIVKDLEDLEGDRKEQAKTLPIVAGIKTTKTITFAIGFLVVVALIYWLFYYAPVQHIWSAVYMGIGIIAPLVYTIYELWKAKVKDEFHCVSQFAKYIMLSGLVYLLFYQF